MLSVFFVFGFCVLHYFLSESRKVREACNLICSSLLTFRFLRRRHRHLLKIKPAETEPEVQHQKSDIQPKKFSRKRKSDANEAVLNKPSQVLPEEGGGEQIVSEPIRVEKKPKNCLVDDEKVGKKKFALQDPVALNV